MTSAIMPMDHILDPSLTIAWKVAIGVEKPANEIRETIKLDQRYLFDNAKGILASHIELLDKGTVPKDANWGMEAVVAGSMYKGISVEKRVETLYNLSVQKGQLTSAQQKELGDIYDLTSSNFIVHASTMGSMSMEKAEFQKGLERTAEGQTYLGYTLINGAVGKMAQYNLDAGVGVSTWDDPANTQFNIESKGGVAAGDVAETVTVAPVVPSIVTPKAPSPASSISPSTASPATPLATQTETSTKNTGKLTGSLDKLTQAERTMVNDLTKQGDDVEIVPRSYDQGIKTPDYKVNGVFTELKSLEGTSLNTPVTRIQKGFKQGAKTVIVDGRATGLTTQQANMVISRINGIYKDKAPGKIEIWTNEGTVHGGE